MKNDKQILTPADRAIKEAHAIVRCDEIFFRWQYRRRRARRIGFTAAEL
jgi:hypothetical protein